MLILLLALLPATACGRYKAREEQKQSQAFAEILKREDRRRISDEFLKGNLANGSPEIRQWCAVALGRVGNPRALPWLYRSLRGNDAALRAASAFAIGQIENRELHRACPSAADSRSVAELTSLLRDSSISVRTRAIEALGKIGSPADAAVIERDLESFVYRGSPYERAYLSAAITALARLGNPAGIPVLERMKDIRDAEIRRTAADAAKRLRSGTYSPASATPGDPDAAKLRRDACGAREIEIPAPGGGTVTDGVANALAAFRKNSTIVRIETSRGPIEIELFRGDAPVTAQRFILMAQGRAFDGTLVARETGAETVEAAGPGNRDGLRCKIRGEINMRPFERGSIGLATADGASDVCRFFIALAPQQYRDGTHTCFGRVLSGMQVADKLASGDRILRVTFKETISFHDYQRY